MGTSAVIAALRSGRRVLAVVRNQDSADRLLRNVGSDKGITFAEANVISDSGIKGVVDRVRAGKLPSFQHVWSSVGGEYTGTPLQDITTEQLRRNMTSGFESNFFAYRDSIGYLLEQNQPASWTICTGAMGDIGTWPVPAMNQGSLFSMCLAAARENESANVRFNEVYLAFRVEVDEEAVQHNVTKASDFATVYESVLADRSVRSSRVWVQNPEDMKKLRYQKKF
ncbi:MAG: hypothetical protein Q9159_001784 [Coniocarpon cinnabarinum]